MMKAKFRRLLPAVWVAVGLTLAASAAGAQTVTPPVTVHTAKPKNLKFKGVVIAANIGAINLRSQENPTVIKTFTYTPAVRDQMIKILNAGGYQPGDKVTVTYAPDTSIAINLSGNPSKPRHF